MKIIVTFLIGRQWDIIENLKRVLYKPKVSLLLRQFYIQGIFRIQFALVMRFKIYKMTTKLTYRLNRFLVILTNSLFKETIRYLIN